MAFISATKIMQRRNDIVAYEWVGASEGDTFEAVEVPHRSDKTIQVSGTFGGTDARVQGTLDADHAIWSQLHDPQGNVVAITTADVETVLENVVAIRPQLVGGSGTSVTIRILMS